MYRNGSELEALLRYNHDIDDQYYQVSIVAYISSDGDDELSFGCRSDNPPLYPFDSNSFFNHIGTLRFCDAEDSIYGTSNAPRGCLDSLMIFLSFHIF